MVFKSRQPCPDTVFLDLDPLLHSGVVMDDVRADALSGLIPDPPGIQSHVRKDTVPFGMAGVITSH